MAEPGDVEFGAIYTGRVIQVVNFGAFIEIRRGIRGLCHISEFADRPVPNPMDIMKPGDTVRAKVMAIDRNGMISLSCRPSALDSV